MTIVNFFLLLLVLFSTFNVGYNLKCYKCKSLLNEVCETEIVTCGNSLLGKFAEVTGISNKMSCVSGTYNVLGEEFKFKDCEDLFKDEGSLDFDLFGVESGFSFDTCNTDLCNGDEKIVNNAVNFNYSSFVYVSTFYIAVIIIIF